MMKRMSYADKIGALLSPAERAVFIKLNTPQKVQDYLDAMPLNFEVRGEEGIYSPREVLKKKKAQCMEGALLAVAALEYNGQRAYLLDLRTPEYDYDHVVALFKVGGRWGAISKTNHPVLRWRDPVYTSVRELAVSYFHEYFLFSGEKTLKSHSDAFSLHPYPLERWLTTEDDLDWLATELDKAKHFPIASPKAMKSLRRASKIERKATEMVEWKDPSKKKA
ncbi:MAG: hypothetical protein JWL87_350 [Candidatus Adlerbacteria bacterium]|nr:hypothetical protein [Candidatus Adlerbacteria bacterium]